MQKVFEHTEIESNPINEALSSELPSLLRPDGLFQIEAKNPIIGEQIAWSTNYYRFKHMISGKYLMIGDDSNLHLEKEPTNSSLFSFHQIQIASEVDNLDPRFVRRDSFFKLCNFNQDYLRFPIYRVEGKGSGRANSEFAKLNLKSSVDDDTLKVNMGNLEEVRQNQFLISVYPILLESLLVLGELNQQITKSIQSKSSFKSHETPKFFKLDQIISKCQNCFEMLIDFLTNKFPSNIRYISLLILACSRNSGLCRIHASPFFKR
jgi:hypothetical protein